MLHILSFTKVMWKSFLMYITLKRVALRIFVCGVMLTSAFYYIIITDVIMNSFYTDNEVEGCQEKNLLREMIF